MVVEGRSAGRVCRQVGRALAGGSTAARGRHGRQAGVGHGGSAAKIVDVSVLARVTPYFIEARRDRCAARVSFRQREDAPAVLRRNARARRGTYESFDERFVS